MTETNTKKYSTGADKSPYDIRTFSYKPEFISGIGGKRYTPSYIEDQHRVGICTSISLTMNARRATGKRYSADFQYLLQKKYTDKNWNEGSSIKGAIDTARKYGLLLEKDWTFTDENDRKLSYSRYIKKLQKVSDEDIEKLLKKTVKIVTAYARVGINRDLMARAIEESEAGILARFVIGNEWWSEPIEPLRGPNRAISGHAITESNYAGNSFRIANSWGKDWADKGTAYHLTNYMPTEAWIVYYGDVPPVVEDQLESRKKIIGQIMDLLQKVIALLPKLA